MSRAAYGRPIPVVAIVADGVLVARDPHEVVVSVTTRRSAEDDTVPDLAAAAAEPLSVQTLGFYAKRFAGHSA